ncbi:MAG: glycosyltransferase [Acidobacteria bacterium]|nr:glycosyltransferase [Acidobacteriota bacterium]
MRVCHLTTTLDFGGAELMLARLGEGMDRRRFPTAVMRLAAPGPVADRIRAAGVDVTTLDMRRGWPAPSGLLRLAGRLRALRPGVLQTWLYHADLLGLAAGRLAGVPRILWNVRNSNMRMERYGFLSRRTLDACRLTSRHPDGIVVNSRAGYEAHRRIGYRPRVWYHIPNGIDTALFRPDAAARARVRLALGVPPDAPLIGFAARVDPMKDHDAFLRAAALLVRRRPAARFLLAGEGTQPGGRLDDPVRRAGLGGGLLRLGARADMAALTAALDVATAASRGEGFPNVVAEALACGVPCVVTDVGDGAEIVGGAGVVVPPENPERLAAAWADLIDRGPAARRDLGSAGRARIAGSYSLARAVRRYERLYASVARGDLTLRGAA